MKTFFVSDTHFGHANIVKYSGRPFADIDEMDTTIIANWNAIVGPGDTVYHLGDFAMGNAAKYRDRLAGNIHLIRGNHERAADAIAHRFAWVKDVHMANVAGQQLWLSHYSHEVWNKSHRGAWHLYGHSHNSLADRPDRQSFDVGIDAIAARLAGLRQGRTNVAGETRPQDYRPMEFSEITRIMAGKTFVAIDHHGAR